MCLGAHLPAPRNYEAEGADGLYDRRLGRLSARRAPVDEVARVTGVVRHCYWDFTAKHFHEKLVADHGFKSQLQLAAAASKPGRRRAAPRRRGAPGKRPRRALRRHDVAQIWLRATRRVPGRWPPAVTMHDATSDLGRSGLGLPSPKRAHMSASRGCPRRSGRQGPVLLALRRPRQG